VDGVERIMVLGIFAVIVAILGVAAWSVTQDGGADPVGAADGGALTGTALKIEEPGDRKSALEAQSRLADVILGRTPRAEAKAGKGALGPQGGKNGKNQPNGADLAAQGGSAKTLPRPPGPGGTQQQPKNPQGKPNAKPGRGGQGGQVVDPALAQGGKLQPEGQKPKPQSQAQKPKPQPKPKAPTYREYTVVKGDGLWGIARRELGPDNVKKSVEAIQALNPGVGELAIGQVLKLPVAKATTPAAPAAGTKAPTGFRHYVVQSGDSLSVISERELGTTSRVDELFELNKDQMATKHDLKIGQRLLIPNS
jgi:LysM repeat protein